MPDYQYLNVVRSVGAYTFNLGTNIGRKVGRRPDGIIIVGEEVNVRFNTALDAAEQTALDEVFAAPDPYAPTLEISGQTYVILDIWEIQEDIKTETGIDFTIYYTESVPGSGIRDRIELRYNQILTNPARNSIENAIADRMTWE